MTTFTINNTDMKKISESGQCFNMFKVEDGRYFIISGERACWGVQKGTSVMVECEDSDVEYWKKYFDVDNPIYEKLLKVADGDGNSFIRESLEFGKGLRVVKQDIFECLISFIVSQRKSIPAIKSTLSKLSEKYGELCNFDGVSYYSFPHPGRLVWGYGSDRFSECGLGYRDGYVYQAARDVLDGTRLLERLYDLGYTEAREYLMGFYGVGEKVADCVCLYSLGMLDAFPVDVWVRRLLVENFTTWSYKDMLKRYEGMLGLLQLYMFYYKRNM